MLLALWVGLKASIKASVIPADEAEQRYASGSLVFQPVSHVPVRLSPKAVTVSPLEAATIRCMSRSPKDLPLIHGRNTPYSPTLEHIKGGYLASLYSSRPTVLQASAVLPNPGRHIQGELCWVRARRWQVCVGCGLDLIVCRLGSDCRRVLCVVGSMTALKKGATRAP